MFFQLKNVFLCKTKFMKRIHILFLSLSFIILVIACSLLSMSAVASNYRFTLVAMNPWNGVEGIAFTIGYFLHTSATASMCIAIVLLLIIWWRLYAVLIRTFGHLAKRNKK